jgi:hypothetical protein
VGPVPVSWWAIWDGRSLTERFIRRLGGWIVTPSYVLVPGVMELFVGDAQAVEVVSPHGSQYAWTRKRGGVAVRGWAAVDGRRLPVDAFGLVDESAGYHARETAWCWAAGVGVAADGARVAWNLVDGLHDGGAESERALWVDGAPRPLAPVTFTPDLTAVTTAPARSVTTTPPAASGAIAPAPGGAPSGGLSLRFTAEARRARRDRLLLVSSDYEQPFGTFAGELPGVGELREGWGVMERHVARW